MSRQELSIKHSGYYNYILKTGIIDEIVPSKYSRTIKNTKSLQKFLEKDKTARNILSLGVNANGYLIDAIEVLAELYPSRIKDSSQFSRLTVDSKESLGDYLGGYVSDPSNLSVFTSYVEGLSEDVLNRTDVNELLFNISKDSYMKSFNKAPYQVLQTISEEKDKIDNNYVSDLLGKVEDFYQGVLEMDIPGIQKLSEAAA